MGEEFGTVNVKQGESVQTELLRRHYRAHRDALSRLVSDSPSERLTSEYQRLISEIDAYLHKLDEIPGKTAAASDTNPMMRTGPGTRQLVRPAEPVVAEPAAGSAPSRIALIVVAGAIVLGLIGWLIWRASSSPKGELPVVEQPVTTTTEPPPPAVTPAPPPAAPALAITPATADYGIVRQGTRKVRRFEIANTGDAPVEVEVARSACRCLFYEYNGKLAAKGKQTLIVTLDAARVKGGKLHEQIAIAGKTDPAVKVEFSVQATIK